MLYTDKQETRIYIFLYINYLFQLLLFVYFNPITRFIYFLKKEIRKKKRVITFGLEITSYNTSMLVITVTLEHMDMYLYIGICN